jgi:hypothetical protein
MISKIIQKEKEQQEQLLIANRKCEFESEIRVHKQSLINLKEYLEGEIKDWGIRAPFSVSESEYAKFQTNQLKEDIQELNKMIERYN